MSEHIEIDEPVSIEDWRNVAEGFLKVSLAASRRAEKAEAAIQRVRDTCEAFDEVRMDIPLNAIRRALDGGA